MTDSVFREITFSFRGEEYAIVPSVAVLRRIKAKGINTTTLANQCIQGGVDLLDLAEALRIFLAEAEEKVSVDDAYAWLTTGSADVVAFQLAYVQSVMPGIDFGKKPVAPAKKTPTRKRTPKAT